MFRKQVTLLTELEFILPEPGEALKCENLQLVHFLVFLRMQTTCGQCRQQKPCRKYCSFY
jgi:hypothetical protein